MRTGGPGRRRDVRPRWERRIRRAWREGAGPLLRAASVVFRLGAAARDALWASGVLRPARASIPVISVGGLTVGGSGKTPLAAELARRISPGRRPGIVTHGFSDEVEVHEVLSPGVVVTGDRDRLAAVEAAAAAGAEVAVVDGGFQHRPLWRDADVVAVSARARPREARVLPAGPYREGWSALGRADAVVVVRRTEEEARSRRLARWLETAAPGAVVARCLLRPTGLRAANDAAGARERPEPAVAVASIMYPEVFLAQLRGRIPAPDVEFVLPDHADLDAGDARWLAETAGERGAVGTLKDVVKLRRALPEGVPLWYLGEELDWEAGEDELAGRLEELTARRRGSRHGPGPGPPMGTRGRRGETSR